MLNKKQSERLMEKLSKYSGFVEPYIFTKVGECEMEYLETMDDTIYTPPASGYKPVLMGEKWGGKEKSYCWTRGVYTVPKELDGKKLFIYPKTGYFEGLLYVNGIPAGNFASKIIIGTHGNHYCKMICDKAKAGDKIEIAIEFYAGHYIPLCAPFEEAPHSDWTYSFAPFDICTGNEDIAAFVFDLDTLCQLEANLPEESFRKGNILNCLENVYAALSSSVEDSDESEWRPALREAREIMAPCLARKNGDTPGRAGIIGHSHMDTAWLWPISETIKKCARTYSNAVSLMNQYPEYTFIQSSAYHSEMMRLHYPELFEKIAEKVKSGSYEPNGGVWVECDCNITGGESMIRQFLWGQRFTRKYFGYTANCFWLPDTFGYSAAIPQIMKSFGVDYFLTTKLSWNDTNLFPYDTFYWQGIDGTKVFSHFNTIHCWPDPEDLIRDLNGHNNTNHIQHKNISDMRVISYGHGDGGGGPQFEEIEMSRRVKDLEGCPKAEHIKVGEFMQEMEETANDVPVYSGELYLELHRGTLTNRSKIKRNNRIAEIALHDLELVRSMKAMNEGTVASDEDIHALWDDLLVNQFHDILPGTCIEEAHERSERETDALIAKAKSLTASSGRKLDKTISFVNPASFDSEEIIYIDDNGLVPENCLWQRTENVNGEKKIALKGIKLPALSSKSFKLLPAQSSSTKNAVSFENNVIETEFLRIVLSDDGAISSFVDKRYGRDVAKGELNRFMLADDVPLNYDNWDLDADYALKLKPVAAPISREVISSGELELRIRSKYQITAKTTLVQDMIVYPDSLRVDFETVIDWNDKHKFLKTSFDTNISSGFARHEIQFGHCLKPTTRNTTIEQAMFEVVNHKFTDISETRYGVAVLNDCKYGVSAEGGNISLSLHKGGCRPDYRGDQGVHYMRYSFLPHEGSFSAENVVKPAYLFNYLPGQVEGELSFAAPIVSESPNVIIETVKPLEDAEKAVIVRAYEAEGTMSSWTFETDSKVKKAKICNMMEEVQSELDISGKVSLPVKPFEIVTLKLSY